MYTENETLNSMVPPAAGKEGIDAGGVQQLYKEKFFDFEDPIVTIRT